MEFIIDEDPVCQTRAQIARDLVRRAEIDGRGTGVGYGIFFEKPHTTATMYCSPVLLSFYFGVSEFGYDQSTKKMEILPLKGLTPLAATALATKADSDIWDAEIGRNTALVRAARALADDIVYLKGFIDRSRAEGKTADG